MPGIHGQNMVGICNGAQLMRDHQQTRGIVAKFGPDRLLDQPDVSISTWAATRWRVSDRAQQMYPFRALYNSRSKPPSGVLPQMWKGLANTRFQHESRPPIGGIGHGGAGPGDTSIGQAVSPWRRWLHYGWSRPVSRAWDDFYQANGVLVAKAEADSSQVRRPRRPASRWRILTGPTQRRIDSLPCCFPADGHALLSRHFLTT